MIKFLLAVALAVFSVCEARADDTLHFAAQPAWVAPVATPAAKPADGAYTIRLLDLQVYFDDRGMHAFARQLVRINTPEGLQVAGNVGLMWQPAFGGATVHRVMIHRGGDVIDAMKDGKGFQVLRREAGLESLTITGILTAIFQVPDLRVGDELEVAYTIDSRNPVLAGHAESMFPFMKMPAVDRISLRYSWPVGRMMKWTAGPLAPKGSLTRQGNLQVLTIASDTWAKPDIPAGAPGRFSNAGTVQLSDFADWAAVTTVMKPLFARASTIDAGSPVMAEVKRIAALSPDPKIRASEALRVVQSQVRYLARVDGLGNYTPESADTVWNGKSGDCKGKTVLLLAMLRALGIDAQPALVSATDGDGLDGSLAMPGRFNHVIVRASIGGKVYWLDGTRLGDKGVDSIAVPGFKWALPLDDDKPALAALTATEPSLPDTEYRLDLDARAGLGKPAKATGSVTYRGETGSQMRLSFSLLGATQRDDFMRKMWAGRFSWIDLETVAYTVDDKTGDVVASFTGKAKLTWSTSGLDSAKRYEADFAQLGRDLAPKREKDVDAAPVAVDGDYTLNRETILLPDGGKGFSIEGDAFDKVVGGVRYVRTAALKDGKFDMTAAASNRPFEISYAAAKQADKLTDGLFSKELFIRAPSDYDVGAVATAADAPGVETTATDTSLTEITRLSVAGKNDEALKLVDARIGGGERTAPILAMRGQLLSRLGQTKDADAAFDQALATDRRDPAALLGKAQMLVDAERLEDSLILYDRLALLRPDSLEVYRKRGQVRFDLGDRTGAISDATIVIAKEPEDFDARYTRAILYLDQGKDAEALGEARDMLKLKPDDGDAHWLQGYVFAATGHRAEAIVEFDRAIAILPKSGAYFARLNFDLEKDDKARLADMLELIKLDPSSDVPALALRRLLADPAARAAIAAAYDLAVESSGDDVSVVGARDMMRAIGGDPQPYVAAADAALAKTPDDAELLNQSCWRRAMFKVELDKATTFCEKSLTKDRNAAVLDSRGLVWLHRGDWAKADADFSDALAMRPRMASSLFGRGLARARLGQGASAKADLAAAKRIDPTIANDYLIYGLKP